MRVRALVLLLCAGCGALSSGPGAPEHPPASGLGPIVPWSDDTGLSWTSPYILSDAARAFAHPAALVDGQAIDLWVEVKQGDARSIGHAHAAGFAAGFGALEAWPIAKAPWAAGEPSSPAVVRTGEGLALYYLADGQIGLSIHPATGAPRAVAAPIYADPAAPIRSLAAALADEAGDRVRLVFLVGDGPDARIDEVVLSPQDPSAAPVVHRAVVARPPWAEALVDVGLRIDTTPGGRRRQDVYLAGTLPQPSTGDLGTGNAPGAIGAASRYLAAPEGGQGDPPLAVAPAPILAGPPPPRGPCAVAYAGGVLLFYVARSGPRDAIGVARYE